MKGARENTLHQSYSVTRPYPWWDRVSHPRSTPCLPAFKANSRFRFLLLVMAAAPEAGRALKNHSRRPNIPDESITCALISRARVPAIRVKNTMHS
jgi:hypothetical protein